MTERMTPDRVSLLIAGSQARQLDAALAGLDGQALRRLQICARINLEQAQAAARTVIFQNATIVIAALVLSNQVFPGWISRWLTGGELIDTVLSLFLAIVFIAIMALVCAYAWGGVASARDLKHLLELHVIGLDDESLATGEPETGVVETLRDMQVSDF